MNNGVDHPEQTSFLARATLEHPRALHRHLSEPPGTWTVDDIARRIPWRSDLEDIPSLDEKLIWTRLAVMAAHSKAREAQARFYGERTTRRLLRDGDPLLKGARLSDLVEAKESMQTEFAAEQVAKRLRIDRPVSASALRAASVVPRGRPDRPELKVFVEQLAGWWWRNTARQPEKRPGDYAGHVRRQRKAAAFFEFAEAALRDSSPGGSVSLELGSAVRRSLEAMEKSGKAPWL